MSLEIVEFLQTILEDIEYPWHNILLYGNIYVPGRRFLHIPAISLQVQQPHHTGCFQKHVNTVMGMKLSTYFNWNYYMQVAKWKWWEQVFVKLFNMLQLKMLKLQSWMNISNISVKWHWFAHNRGMIKSIYSTSWPNYLACCPL